MKRLKTYDVLCNPNHQRFQSFCGSEMMLIYVNSTVLPIFVVLATFVLEQLYLGLAFTKQGKCSLLNLRISLNMAEINMLICKVHK